MPQMKKTILDDFHPQPLSSLKPLFQLFLSVTEIALNCLTLKIKDRQ